MSNIREEIQEAQRLFHMGKAITRNSGRGMKHDGDQVAIISNQGEKVVLVSKRLTELLAQSTNTIDQENPNWLFQWAETGHCCLRFTCSVIA